MTICRYFAQGWCRFGDRCRFEHVDNSYQSLQPQRERDRYHWVKPGAHNTSTATRAASFDFNATLQTARASEQGGWSRGGGGGWDQGRHQNTSSSHGGSFFDYAPKPGGGYREPFKEEPRSWGQPRTAFGSAAAFDFNRALDTARRKDADRYVAEDMDMVESQGWETGRSGSRRPSQQGQPAIHQQAQPQSTFVFGETQTSKPAPIWSNQQRDHPPKTDVPVASTTVSGEDYRYTRIEELEPRAKEQYLAVNFTLGKIPVQPPPLEYCR
ncbi:uncharacterized protein LOC135365970 [Ornithodoros turicata]|uniref:uncharacterized protein LOC135365970 n=1 Tax=Ornithodoros turicata TaxID=34597 RepID=UPI00313924D0